MGSIWWPTAPGSSRWHSRCGAGRLGPREPGATAFRDLLSQERLAAFVDKRIGQRSLQGLGSWSQVQAAFDHWGEQLANRLAVLRGAAAKENSAVSNPVRFGIAVVCVIALYYLVVVTLARSVAP